MSIFQLGAHAFITFSELPTTPRKQLQIETRSGVAGETVWNTGTRGEPMQLLAIRDAPDVGAAKALVKQYEELIGADPQPLTWANSSYDQTQFIVLNVRPIPRGVHALLGGRGGISGQSGFSFAMLRVVFDLLPVDTTL